MDILQVSRYYYPHVGGVERVVQNISEGLKDRYDFHVLCTHQKGRTEGTTINGVKVTRVSSQGELYSLPISPQFPARFYQLASRSDIVHHHLPNPLSVLSELLSPDTGAKTVVTYHSDIVRQASMMRFYKPLLYRFLESVDQIVVTSPNLMEHSDHLSQFKNKCTTIPLSVDVQEILSRSGDPSDFPLESDRPIVLFVGRLNYYKGVEYLIESMATVDANLIIIGDGKKRDKLEELVVKLGVGSKIEFIGHVPDEKLHYYYDVADIFVLPSVEPSEAFGIVQLEAMAHATPVINTDLPSGVPWVSIDGETGLTVPPRDIGALSAALTKLVAEDDLRERYGKAARNRVETTFGRKKMLENISALYEDSVRNGESGPD